MINALWAYFWLLIFEGALRKWVLPQFSAPLLVVRDPVLLWAYYNALKSGFFPRNGFMYAMFILATLCTGAGLMADHGSLFVTIYGVRANYLHLPLIYLMPRVMDSRDVDKFGRWIMLLSLPMALLMTAQFRAPGDSVINQGLLGEFVQITSALGKVRAAGTFSFITGPILFFSLVAAFCVAVVVEKRSAGAPLVLPAVTGLLIALAISGSRSVLLTVLVVGAALAFACLLRPSLLPRSMALAAVVGVLGLAVSANEVFREGLDIFLIRIEQARMVEANEGGLAARFDKTFNLARFYDGDKPYFGHGIGLGTNAGAGIVSGRSQFLLAEEEWPRIILESGYMLGLPYIIMRILMFFSLLGLSLRRARAGQIMPILLLACGGPNLVMGAFGQPTILGFTVFVCGLCLTQCGLEEARP